MDATTVFYRVFPDFRELKQKADDLLKKSKQIYEKGVSLYQYLTENKVRIVNKIGETFQQAAGTVLNNLENTVKSTWNAFKRDFSMKYESDGFNYSSEHHINNPVFFQAQEYHNVASKNKNSVNNQAFAHSKQNLECVLDDERYCEFRGFAKTSAMITDMYNLGYKTKEIKREMKHHNIVGVNNYDDVLEGLAFGISNGDSYIPNSYNSRLAEKLGANKQIIQSYESGKSFSEIRSEFSKRTGGMNISYSSYRRLLRKNNACRLNSG